MRLVVCPLERRRCGGLGHGTAVRRRGGAALTAATGARIVILGGGFGGVAAALELERRLTPAEASITLVSRENFTLFTPLLPEVASGGLGLRDVLTPVRTQLRRSAFLLGDVCGVDLDARTVDVEHALLGGHIAVPYDQLVLALGSVTSTFGLSGVAERALPLKTIEDAARLRNRVITMLELADAAGDAAVRRRLLTFVFVGGGFTGVEAAGEMVGFFGSVRRFYRTIGAGEIRVVLVEGGPRLLPDLDPKMGEYAARFLARRGVEIVLGDRVTGVDEAGLNLASGAAFDAETIVWSAGVKPPGLIAKLPLRAVRGAVVVAEDMSVPGRPGLWAIGDCAAIPDGRGGHFPATAQHAIREGPSLARNVAAVLRGLPTKPFRYKTMGMMASLGGRRAVIGLPGGRILTGFVAWFVWRTYYLLRLAGLDRKLRVAFGWTLDLVFPRDISELRLYSPLSRERAAEDSGLLAAKTPPTAD